MNNGCVELPWDAAGRGSVRATVNCSSWMNDVPKSPTGMMHLLHCAIVIDMAWRSWHGTAGQDEIRLQKQSAQTRPDMDGWIQLSLQGGKGELIS